MAPTSDHLVVARRRDRARVDGAARRGHGPCWLGRRSWDRRTCPCLSPTLRPWIRCPALARARRRSYVEGCWSPARPGRAARRRGGLSLVGGALVTSCSSSSWASPCWSFVGVLGPRTERGRPNRAALVGRGLGALFASGRTLRRGSRPSGCRNGLGSSRWRAGEPDPASKVAQVEDGCKPEDPPGPRRSRPRDGSARPSSAKEDSRGTGSIPEIARTGLPATANGATVADGMKRPLHIECSNFVPAGGGYAWLRAGGRQADPSTLEST